MKKIKAGLVKGRHDLPVEHYIFNEIKDVMDFDFMKKEIRLFLLIHRPEVLDLYITGLTSASLEVVSSCLELGVSLNAYHYDHKSGSYKKQPVLD